MPAPGFYNVFKSLKEQEQEVKRYSARKIIVEDRKTFLDSVKFDATASPGVGNYNIRVKLKLLRDDLKQR